MEFSAIPNQSLILISQSCQIRGKNNHILSNFFGFGTNGPWAFTVRFYHSPQPNTTLSSLGLYHQGSGFGFFFNALLHKTKHVEDTIRKGKSQISVFNHLVNQSSNL